MLTIERTENESERSTKGFLIGQGTYACMSPGSGSFIYMCRFDRCNRHAESGGTGNSQREYRKRSTCASPLSSRSDLLSLHRPCPATSHHSTHGNNKRMKACKIINSYVPRFTLAATSILDTACQPDPIDLQRPTAILSSPPSTSSPQAS